MPATTPSSGESDRLIALGSYHLLDTPAEPGWDDVTRLAAAVCQAPIAFISLIDADREWFKSRIGIERAEVPRTHSFGVHAFAEDGPLVVQDARADPRFGDNPLVNSEPGVRFYAAVALRTAEGHALGALSVMDRRPRGLDAGQLDAIGALARQVVAQMELRRTLRVLEQERAFVSEMMDSSIEGLVILQPTGQIERVNPALVNLFGYPASAIVGRAIEEFLADPNPHGHGGPARPSLAAAIGQLTEWEGRRANGEVFPLQALVWAFGPPSDRRLACHVRDLSKQREAEHTKRQFVAHVSHELRTPLTAIRGALALTLDADRGMSEESRELLTAAQRNAYRLLTLVNDLLDLERVASGHQLIAKRPCSLAAVVDHALDTTRPMARDAGVSIRRAPTAVQIEADPNRLAQVLINLVANAIRYSPRGGMVTIGVVENLERVVITVDDQGPGVPPAFRQRIFEPYRQIVDSPEHERGGTGLGLAISRAIVAEHGGTLDVGDAPGGGARFVIDMPHATAP
jgi:PAS domain S-box-containing protein